jgi:hypothetical protein
MKQAILVVLILMSFLKLKAYPIVEQRDDTQSFIKLITKRDTKESYLLCADLNRRDPADGRLFESCFNYYYDGHREEIMKLHRQTAQCLTNSKHLTIIASFIAALFMSLFFAFFLLCFILRLYK